MFQHSTRVGCVPADFATVIRHGKDPLGISIDDHYWIKWLECSFEHRRELSENRNIDRPRKKLPCAHHIIERSLGEVHILQALRYGSNFWRSRSLGRTRTFGDPRQSD